MFSSPWGVLLQRAYARDEPATEFAVASSRVENHSRIARGTASTWPPELRQRASLWTRGQTIIDEKNGPCYGAEDGARRSRLEELARATRGPAPRPPRRLH